MDKLPIEIHCIIVGFVDVPTLLTCRLVCRAWNKFVETTLAKVTHVKINQNAIEDSPIPNILLGHLYARRFVCHDDIKITALHTFIASKCPNVKAYSFTSRPSRGANVSGFSTSLLYFETRFYEKPADSFSCFSSLIACDANFCAPCHLNSALQYSDICRDPLTFRPVHPSINNFTAEKLQALKWYDYCEKKEEQLEGFPACPSLEILRCNFYLRRGKGIRPFLYPNLKYFRCENLSEDLQPFLSSLKLSRQLRAIEIESVENGRTFLDFIAKLKHLEHLKIGWIDTEEEIIKYTLNDSLKYVSIVTDKACTFTNKHHEKLQFLTIKSTRLDYEKAIECSFPSLREAYFDLPFAETTFQFICQFRSSKKLKKLELYFRSYCDRADEIFKLVSELVNLEYVHISLQLNMSQPRKPIELDISRHKNLEEVNLKLMLYHGNSLIVKVAIGDLDYDHLRSRRGQLKMRKQGVYRRKCIIDCLHADLLPSKEEEPKREFFSFEKLEVALEYFIFREEIDIEIDKFTNLMAKMNRLKHLTLSTERWEITLDRAKLCLNVIAKLHTLETLELDLNIEAGVNCRSDEKIIIDARQLPSLQKLVFKLSSEGKETRHIKLSLLLGDCYNELAFVGENALEGELVTHEKFKFLMPKYSEVDFTGPMDQLRSLSITDWTMVKDTSELFEACKSIDSLHMNKADHIRSLIPTLAQLGHLNRLSGQLSHTFLRMFLTRIKQHRVLNVHFSLKPIVEKIQKKTKIAHPQICYFDQQ